jgi:regulator of sigma E protease
MEPGDDDAQGFNRKPVGQRMLVLVAGSLMNFLLAAFLYALIFMSIGLPSDSNVVGNVLPGKPAAIAGMQSGDKIVAINGQTVNYWSELVERIHNHAGEAVTLMVERSGQVITLSVVPELDPKNGVGLIGIEQLWQRLGLFAALATGFKQTAVMIMLLLTSFGQMITGKIPAELAGPVGIVQLVGQAASFGIASILGFAAFLSLNLGLINLLPIPALDGSRIVFLAFEKLRGRPLNPEKENFIHLLGFAILMLLLVLVTYQDITRIFG